MTLIGHYLQPRSGNYIEDLRSRIDPSIQLTHGPDQAMPPDTQLLISGRPTFEQLSSGSKLHTLLIPWAGIPAETRELMVDFPHISVHNLHHNAVPVAEMAVTLLMSAAKLILPMDHSLRDNDWTPRYRPSTALLLDEKTALILGYGAIGSHVARLCKQIGMNILAVRRNVTGFHRDSMGIEVYPISNLHGLLPRAEVVVVCLPHTPETDGLLGREEIALMPSGAVLVNIGRGLIIDEEALFIALRSGQLHSAGLDVWYNYPAAKEDRIHTPPSNFPFHNLDNCVMSPHRAGSTRETNGLRIKHLSEFLNAASNLAPLPNQVDLEMGY